MRYFFFSLLLLISGSLQAQQRTPERADALTTRATFAGAVSRAMPAVVNIYAARRVNPANTPARPGTPFTTDPLLQQLYGQQAPLKQKIERSLGSGVIVRPEGIVVTNLHVITGADTVKVSLSDSREFDAKLLAGDDKTDLAILQLQLPTNTRLPVAKFGDATTLRAGDVVLALGNPFGIGQSVSMGVVSAVERSNANLSPYAQFIQTDAAINPGNSGGALIDSTGAIVGINTAIFTHTGSTVGIGFAIPAEMVQTVVNDILRTGAVTRPWLGAEGQGLNPALAARLGLASGPAGSGGIYLESVVAGSPAAQAGLQPGDIVTALDGKPVADPGDLSQHLLATPTLLSHPGSLTILRGGQKQEVPVQFQALPPRLTASRRAVTGYSPLAGSTLENLGPALNVELSLPLATTGVALISAAAPTPGIEALSPAPQPGDVLLTINRQRVATVDDALAVLSQSRRHWQVTVQRAGKTLTLATP